MFPQVYSSSRPSVDDPLGLFEPKRVSAVPQLTLYKEVVIRTEPQWAPAVSRLGSRDAVGGTLASSLWSVAAYAQRKFALTPTAPQEPALAMGLRQNLGDSSSTAHTLMAALRGNLSAAYRELVRLGM